MIGVGTILTLQCTIMQTQIVRELGKFLENGGIYKGHRPVSWSVVENSFSLRRVNIKTINLQLFIQAFQYLAHQIQN